MDKFRDVIMKLSENSSPKQRSFIEDHLTKFLSDFNPPDHPPYAAMIHRAIQELNEKGGSTEESISKYIKKQYADLPWAHNSLVKHHLGNLCDCGEILFTRKKFYSLAGANPNLDCPIRPKKGHLKRKQKGESRRGQGRQGKKNEAEECDKRKEEHCEVIGEHNKCNTEQGKFTGEHNEIKEYKVDMVGEYNQVPKLLNEVTEELTESDEHLEVIGNETCDQQIEAIQDGEHELRDGRTEGQSQPPRENVGISAEPEQGQPRWQETGISAEQSLPQQKQEGYAICATLIDSNVQIEHLEEQNQPDLSNPERTPGFELATFKELSQSLEQTKDLVDLEYEVLPNSERLSEVELPIVKDFSETLQQIKERQRQHKHEGRDPSDFSRSAPSTIMMKLLPVKHQQQQPELSTSEGLQQGKSKDLEFLEQNKKQLKQYGRRKQVKSQAKERKAKDVSVDSEHIKQKQQSDLSDFVKSSGWKLTIVESFTTEKQQQLEICGQQEATESQTGAMVPMDPKWLDKQELPDKLVPGSLTELQQVTARHQQEGRKTQYVPIDSEQIKQKQQLNLSEPEQSSALKLKTVESFLKEKQLQQLEICGEQQAPEPQSGARLTSSHSHMDAKQLDKEERAYKSVPGSPIKPKQVTAKSQTQLEQRQVVRRSLRLAKSKQTVTFSVDLLPCSQLQDHHLGQPELQDCELTQEMKQKSVEESTHTTKQQAKRHSWQKHKTSQPNIEPYSLDLTLKSEQSLLQVEESAQIMEQRAKLCARQKPKKSQPNTVTNSLDVSLAHKQKDESTQIVEQRAKLRSWRKRYSHSNTETGSLHSPMALEQVELEERPKLPCSGWYKQAEALEDLPRQQQVALAQGKPTCMKLRRRPPKLESEAAASPIELSPLCHQHDSEKQPERHDRGRPPKPKPDTVEVQQMQSDHQNHNEQRQRARRAGGRPPKLTAKAEVIFNTNSPYNSHREQEAQKRTYQGRGRPLKPKQTTSSTTHFIPSSKQHQQHKCRGRGRPRKMDQGSE